jgi:signal transduction histidine kinase
MSSESSTIASASPLSFTDGNSADGERFLADASARLAESLDVFATIRTLSELAVESFADGCRITMLDDDAQARGRYPFVDVAVHSRSPERAVLAAEMQRRFPFPVDAPAGFPSVIRTGRAELHPAEAFAPPALARRARNDEHLEMMRRLDIRTVMITPLIARGHTLGAVTLARHGPGDRPPYTPRDLHLAEELGRRAGVAIDNARLYAAEQSARASAEQSEAQLTDVLDSMIEAVYGYDRDWRVVRLNRDARARLRAANLEPEAVMGRSLWKVFPELVGTPFELFLRRAMEERRPAQFIERDIYHDRWLDVRVIPTAEGVSAYVNDITPRIVADQQRDLLLRVGELVRQSLDPARTLDAIARAALPEFADYTIVDLFDGDGSIKRVTGAHADPAQMPTLMRLLAAPATIDGRNFLSRVLRTGEPVLAKTIDDATIESLSDDPEVRAIVHALAPRSCIVVPLAADGPTLGALLLGRSRAITRSFTDGDLSVALEIGRRAAAALEHARLFDAQRSARERAERLQNLSAALTRAVTSRAVVDVALLESSRALGSASVSLCLLDDDGKMFTTFAGVGVPDDVAASWRRFPVEYDCRVSDAVRTRMPCYSLSRAEFVGNQPGMIELAARMSIESSAALPLVAGERILGALVFSFNTPRRFSAEDDAFLRATAGQIAQSLERARLFEAERKARELAESANRAKGEFLAVMSHELRNPLNSISGYVELLEMGVRGPVTPGQREDLHRIQEGQQQLLLLLNEVLNYARLESGAVKYDLQPTIVADVVAATIQRFEPQRAAKMLKVVLELSHSTAESPHVVIADPDKLQQILLNLLINTARFTPVGGRVRVRCTPFAGEASRLAIRIGDGRLDIPDDQHDAVFEPFGQVGRSPSAPGEGTGLGLAISRDLARGMGGTLKVETLTGGGSVFTLVLPRGA